MIVSCEKCNARYLLASLLLGMSGRKVRCGVCGHTWFQEPVDEEPLPSQGVDDDEPPSFTDHLEQEILESIPEGVKPIPEGSAVPVVQEGKNSFKGDGVAAGLVAAAVFFIVLAALVAFRGPVSLAWPPSARLFQMVGLPVPVPGEGLIFDQVKAVAQTDGTLNITGNIINLHARPSPVPKIRATLRENEDITGDTWMVPVENEEIGPEETISFTGTYEGVPEAMKEVNLRFVLE